MAKARKSKKVMPSMPAVAPLGATVGQAPQFALGYDPTGKMEDRRIVSTQEGWSSFKLDDGTIIRAKAIVLNVKEAVKQYNLQGDPIYVMQMTLVQDLKVPPRKKKK